MFVSGVLASSPLAPATAASPSRASPHSIHPPTPRRLNSFTLTSRARSSSSSATSGFLRITVGSKRSRPSAALSWNVLRVGECASCSPLWRSRAVDWPLRLPICTWPACRGAGLRSDGDGACDVGSREESAGAAAAALVMCCAVRCACRASACVCCVFDVCCRKRGLVLRCVAAHCSGCIKRAVAFILVCRPLLPPALRADATF